MAKVGILNQNDRLELIAGKIIEMSPIGSEHAACVDKMVATFNKLDHPTILVRGQNPVRLSDYSEPEPDIAIVKYNAAYYANYHPSAEETLLIIEVSDSSLDYDREVKLPLYASSKIPEYWIVNLEKKEIEVYRSPIDDGYRHKALYRLEDEITIEAICLSLEVSNLLI